MTELNITQSSPRLVLMAMFIFEVRIGADLSSVAYSVELVIVEFIAGGKYWYF